MVFGVCLFEISTILGRERRHVGVETVINGCQAASLGKLGEEDIESDDDAPVLSHFRSHVPTVDVASPLADINFVEDDGMASDSVEYLFCGGWSCDIRLHGVFRRNIYFEDDDDVASDCAEFFFRRGANVAPNLAKILFAKALTWHLILRKKFSKALT